jgi:signal transduction histidine kinase
VFLRERSFTADVAHELRTPLAGVRSTIEVTLSSDRRPGEYREALDDCLQIAVRMQWMVENLLMLARLDAGQMTFRRQTIPLFELADTCWRLFSERAGARGVVFENRIPGELSCVCDSDGLTSALTNLFQNAVDYTQPGGRVWVEGRRTGDRIQVSISNTGCRLTPEECSQVFERFWRADPSRRDTGKHAGLGLALVRRILSSLGGEVTAEVDAADVFTVRITLDAESP